MYRKIIFGLLRIWLGWQWFSAGLGKVTNPAWVGSERGGAVRAMLLGAIDKSTGPYAEVHGWYAFFSEKVALPNYKLFSILVAYGELFLGIALLIGAFTAFAALGSIFLNLNYLFAGTSSSNPEMLIIGIVLLIFFIPAGRLGVDYYITPKLLEVYKKIEEYLKDKKLLPQKLQ